MMQVFSTHFKVLRFAYWTISSALFFTQGAFAQPLVNQWNQVLTITPYDTHSVGDSMAMIGVDEDGATRIEWLRIDGTPLGSESIPQIEALGSSLYDKDNHCFYIMGTNETVSLMRLLKIDLAGNVIWQKNIPFSGYRFPYQIVKNGNRIAFTYAQLTDQGISSAIGWWLVDTLGTLIADVSYNLPINNTVILPYASCFSSSDQLVLSASRLDNGQCSLYSFQPLNGTLNWSQSFDLAEYATIERVAADAQGNIYATGETGFLIKLSPTGAVLFETTLGYNAISSGFDIIERDDALYIIGSWRDNFNSSTPNANLLVGKYQKETGAKIWTWVYAHTGPVSGPIGQSAFFKNDSSLIIQFSRFFESEWVGEFRLSSTSSTKEIGVASPLQVYPNPCRDLTIRLQEPDITEGIIQVFTESGHLQQQMNYTQQPIHLPYAGHFIVHYTNGTTRKVAKVIAQ
jgi:hypothetical protein